MRHSIAISDAGLRFWSEESGKGPVRLAARELWVHLPAWYFLFDLHCFLVGDLAYFEQPRYDFAAAAIFPLALFATYYWARLRAAGLEAGRRRRLFGILLASVIGLLALTVAATPTIRLGPTPETHAAGVRHFHEMLTLFWVPVIALHCLWNKRLGSFLLFYLAAFVYGMLQESGGVTLGYFSEEGYSWYLPFSHAPAVTMFGWSTVFYPAVAHLEMFERGIQRLRGLGVLGSALLVTVIACFLDAMLDPMASAIGLWVWNGAELRRLVLGGAGLRPRLFRARTPLRRLVGEATRGLAHTGRAAGAAGQRLRLLPHHDAAGGRRRPQPAASSPLPGAARRRLSGAARGHTPRDAAGLRQPATSRSTPATPLGLVPKSRRER
jgi:hypothetical protein